MSLAGVFELARKSCERGLERVELRVVGGVDSEEIEAHAEQDLPSEPCAKTAVGSAGVPQVTARSPPSASVRAKAGLGGSIAGLPNDSTLETTHGCAHTEREPGGTVVLAVLCSPGR